MTEKLEEDKQLNFEDLYAVLSTSEDEKFGSLFRRYSPLFADKFFLDALRSYRIETLSLAQASLFIRSMQKGLMFNSQVRNNGVALGKAIPQLKGIGVPFIIYFSSLAKSKLPQIPGRDHVGSVSGEM